MSQPAHFQSTLILFASIGAFLSSATARGDIPQVYWYINGTMERIGIDGTQRETVISNIPDGWGLDVSVAAGKVYWADRAAGRIQRANLDGSSPEVVVTGLGQPHDVLIDAAANHIYWSDTDLDKIQRADLDGSNVVDILTGVGFVTGMHLDTVNSRIYFSESSTDTVRRVNVDGSDPVILLSSAGLGGGDPRGVDVDLTRGHIYFSDLKQDGIFRADLDGSNLVPFVTGLDKVFDLQILPETDEIYWFENTTARLYRSPLGAAIPAVVETNAAAWGMGITPEPGSIALLAFGVVMLGRNTRVDRRNRQSE